MTHKDLQGELCDRLKLVPLRVRHAARSTTKGGPAGLGSTSPATGFSEDLRYEPRHPVQRPMWGSLRGPVPNVLAQVIDSGDARLRPRPSRSGSLCCTGPNVMSGYWRRPERRPLRFRRDGLAAGSEPATSSSCREGYFHFFHSTASQDLIICKGYSGLRQGRGGGRYAHPQVKAAGVIGRSRPALANRIKAIRGPPDRCAARRG